MRKTLTTIFIATFASIGAAQAAPDANIPVAEALKSELARIGPESFTNPDFKPGTVHHVVLFRYKDGTTDAQRAEIRQRFVALAKEAKRNRKPYIVSIETGRQASGEGVDRGFEEAFIVTFRSEGDRNYYVGTPIVTNPKFFDAAHQRFKEFVGPFLAQDNGVLVFDFAVEGRAEARQTVR
ncbi:Dabb family protein [Phyllobacterium phragmitis]|uniref:Stress-response A/B barrel domain-containing protein n=1 Tax=Phyllobacterium phragmitis TaxID=2670329 RepID=A0ABQ0H5R1_9HYPH